MPLPRPVRAVVLDFDGTCTRVEAIQAGFLRDYGAELYRRLAAPGLPPWEALCARVRAEAPELGWTWDGHATAPGCPDPYVQASVAAWLLRRERPDLEARFAAAGDVFSALYRQHAPPMRAELPSVLARLAARGLAVAFVTNSDPQAVGALLDAGLGAGSALRRPLEVHGNARKFRVTPPGEVRSARLDALPAERRVAGLARPVLLRRGHYVEALERVWRASGAAPEETIVCGDVYELDLSAPAELGCHVHLIERAEPHLTYAYERGAVEALGERGGRSPDLLGLAARLGA
jgi:FMN phosphatase YigB (HAD superfamily)